MATVTIYWKSGGQTSFETFDQDVIRRYENHSLNDPEITRVTVTD